MSYGTGTANGPAAILTASQQLEAFDGIDVPGRAGLFTHPPLGCSATTAPEDVIAMLDEVVGPLLAAGKTPVILGGEHSITLGAVRAADATGPIGVIQFDAHADLRDDYEGTPFSHACVMRRVAELGVPIFQAGVRSLSENEHLFCREADIPCISSTDIYRYGVPDQVLPANFPDRVYLTFDVDALDASLMPATGTPEPGGLLWHDTLALLDLIVAEREVIGFDVVELAPIPGMHAPDYTAARLVYRLMGMIARSH